MVTREQFLKHLRSALNHLYDPDHLRRSPLAVLFDVAAQFNAPIALQRILTEAIKSLEPADDVPSESHAWRVYGPLYYRYVQQLSREQVADQLGVSTRQLSRRTSAALEALTDILWAQFDLEAKLRESPGLEEAVNRVTEDALALAVNEELAWLRDAVPEQSVDLGQILRAVGQQAQPLADRYGVHLETAPTDGLPLLTVHQLALKQALLNLVGVAVRRSEGGRATIRTRPLHHQVEILVAGEPESRSRPPSDDDPATLDMADQLVNICKGRLVLSAAEEAFSARLTLPVLERVPVLAIDDNADTLQLLQRYTSGTRYHLVATRDPQKALELVQKLEPRLILLDVMMPQTDGWELLASLRQHPRTSHIPVVVCTILSQEDMALSLGASGFMRKPVTRQTFLAALDGQIGPKEPQSH